jgi:hypothetical protein
MLQFRLNPTTYTWALGCSVKIVVQAAVRSGVVAYRVKAPLRVLADKLLLETVIPVGSRVEWREGEYYAGGMVVAFWLRRRVLVMEADLFRLCERLAVED